LLRKTADLLRYLEPKEAFPLCIRIIRTNCKRARVWASFRQSESFPNWSASATAANRYAALTTQNPFRVFEQINGRIETQQSPVALQFRLRVTATNRASE